jgi:hypothetical protein
MDRYPVEWEGRSLSLGKLTVGVKQAFCDWLVRKLRADAERDFAGYPAKFNAYADGLRARVWWVADRMSPTVWEWMYKSVEGGRQYARLLLGVNEKELPDADLDRLVDAKEGEQTRADATLAAEGVPPPYPPVNDYMRALAEIHETANPKATARPESSSGPTGM